MRAALISITHQPQDEGTGRPLAVAGLTLARRQLDFALAAGCERILVLSEGASAEAIALNHVAERAAVRFQTVIGTAGLLRAIGESDELLVLAPGLLPEALDALAALAGGPVVLVVPAPAGVAAGFERIDAQRAWAGALVLPGALAARLGELPPDVDPHAALLRVALQARIPEKPIGETHLADGAWSHPRGASEAGRQWLARHLPLPPRYAVTARAAHAVLHRYADRLLRSAAASQALAGASAALLAAGVLLAWIGAAAAGFLGIGLAAFCAALWWQLARLQAAPFGSAPGAARTNTLLTALLDFALAAAGAGALAGPWPDRLFPPLVLMAALRMVQPEQRSDPWALLGDRGVLALLLALSAAAGHAKMAVMLLALATLASSPGTRLTRV